MTSQGSSVAGFRFGDDTPIVCGPKTHHHLRVACKVDLEMTLLRQLAPSDMRTNLGHGIFLHSNLNRCYNSNECFHVKFLKLRACCSDKNTEMTSMGSKQCLHSDTGEPAKRLPSAAAADHRCLQVER